MLSMTEARARVARGAAHLDCVRPGWHDRIDVETLQLSSCSRCVVGQLVGNYFAADGHEGGLAALGLTPARFFQPVTEMTDEVTHGFSLPWANPREESGGRSPEWRCLHDAWVEAITERRGWLKETPDADINTSDVRGTTDVAQPVLSIRRG